MTNPDDTVTVPLNEPVCGAEQVNSTESDLGSWIKKHKVALVGVIIIVIIAIVGTIIGKMNTNKDEDREQSPQDRINQTYSCVVLQYQDEIPYNVSSNPLGDMCKYGTEKFYATCPINGVILERCKPCNSDKGTISIPHQCFCDIGVQFPKCDAPKKSTCEFCRKYSPCQNGGTYICNGPTAHHHNCSCHAAFTGKYCEKDQSVVYLCEETREKIANATLCDFTIPSPNCYVKDDYDRTLLCHNKKYSSSMKTFGKCKIKAISDRG